MGRRVDMHEIIKGLWLGSRPLKQWNIYMRKQNINAILTIDSLPLTDVAFKNYKKLYLYALDAIEEVILGIFKEAFDFIDENISTGVLVHCRAGRSRSATIVIGYLMWKMKGTFKDAFAIVSSKRVVTPNTSFIKQLEHFESVDHDSAAAIFSYMNER